DLPVVHAERPVALLLVLAQFKADEERPVVEFVVAGEAIDVAGPPISGEVVGDIPEKPRLAPEEREGDIPRKLEDVEIARVPDVFPSRARRGRRKRLGIAGESDVGR